MLKDSDVSSERMHFLAERGRCSCGCPLSIAWGGAYGYAGFILRCGKDIDHKDFEVPFEINPYSDTDMPGWKLSKKRRIQLEAKVGPEKKQALMKYEGVATLSKLEAKEIINTMWPGAEKASPAEVFKAITICHQYGLNPLVGHLYLIPFEKKDKKTGQVIGVTYAAVKGINANRVIARRKHSYSYIDNTPRYMTEEEEKRVWKIVDPDQIRYIVTLKDMVTGATASGYGQWSKWKSWTNPKTGEVKKYPNEPKGIDKGNSPETMSSHRAERQALDRLYPADMPSNIPFEDEFAERQQAQVETKEPVIDKETGEIIEGQFSEVGEGEELPLDELPEGDEKTAEPGQTAERAAGKGETDLSSQKGKGQKPRGVSAAEADSPRAYNIRMARSAASKLKWTNERLMEELKTRCKGVLSFDEATEDELQNFASQITDMADCA